VLFPVINGLAAAKKTAVFLMIRQTPEPSRARAFVAGFRRYTASCGTRHAHRAQVPAAKAAHTTRGSAQIQSDSGGRALPDRRNYIIIPFCAPAKRTQTIFTP
jgi:hypothetical protein